MFTFNQLFHLFIVFVVFTTSKLISAQCNSYSDSEQSCLSQFLPNRECWWLDQGQGSGFECTGIMSACGGNYNDQQSCNDNSNGGCEWSGSCQTSMCLEKTDSEMCGGSSDAVGECIWNENNNYCSRNSGGSGGGGGGGTANAPTECSQLNSTTCYNYNLTKAIAPYYGGGCKLNATASCVAYASAEEKKAAEDELARVAAWRAEIDRCGALSSCIDEDCKSNSTGCFPYDTPEEKALALLQAECMKIDTPLGCFAANCDFDGAVCNSFVCTQNGTLENEETVVRVLGPRWSGVNGLQCAMKTKPMSGTKKLRVILDANIGNGKYVQPAGSTGICLRSSNTTHECTSDHSAVVNPLFDHLIVVGVPHTSTGLRPIISGKTLLKLCFNSFKAVCILNLNGSRI